MAKGDDIEARLVRFAVGSITICEELPSTSAAAHISKQLIRSGTSAAPNYAEARGAESTNDFIHKLGIVLKELNESRVWLDMIAQKRFVEPAQVRPLLEECVALGKIIAVSRRTASQNAGRR